MAFKYHSTGEYYALIDSDFTTTFDWNYELQFPWIYCIAKEYERRNLNVAANVALVYQAMYKTNNNFLSSLKNDIQASEEVVGFFQLYLKDINKYMALM